MYYQLSYYIFLEPITNLYHQYILKYNEYNYRDIL